MRHGFTLIQISILLTVASLVMVTLLPSSQTKLNTDSADIAKLNKVLLSLRQFQAANGRLPCPADASQPIGATNYGVEAANPGPSTNCTGGTPAANYTDSGNKVAIGAIPVHTLSLANDYALDAYNRDITYAVDTNATSCGWPSTSFPGTIVVTDNGIAHNTVTALISHGADGHGAWIPLPGSTGAGVRLNAGSSDSDQLTNAHVDNSFNPTSTLTSCIKKTHASSFDDLLVYKNSIWSINTLPITSPAVLSVTGPANGDYESGESQSLTFIATFSAPVTVTGTPRLIVNVGGTTRYATYASGSGTAVLTFSYPLVTADYAPSPTGISMTGAIDLNGGSIKSGSFCVPLSFHVPVLTSVYVNSLAVYIAEQGNYTARRVMVSTGIIITVAGTGVSGFTGDGGAATSAKLGVAYTLNTDSAGNIYIADLGPSGAANRIRKVAVATGTITTVAGNGTNGYTGDGGAATSAQISTTNVAADSASNVYFPDSIHCVVRKVTAATGKISTIAGTGTCGYTGDGAAATSAQLNPGGITVDSSNNFYIGDGTNCVIRKVTIATGLISTVAGNGICGYTGDGAAATSARINIRGLSVDIPGNIYIADSNNSVVRKVAMATGFISTVAGNGISGFSGDGAAATSAKLTSPRMAAADSFGNLYIADFNGDRVRKVTAFTGFISTLAGNGTAGYTGDGGAATAAELNWPQGIATGIIR